MVTLRKVGRAGYPRYGVNTLAYVDSFAGGLVPCKVVSVASGTVSVKITADRPGWRRGEVATVKHAYAPPRKHVRTVNGQYRISNTYIYQ